MLQVVVLLQAVSRHVGRWQRPVTKRLLVLLACAIMHLKYEISLADRRSTHGNTRLFAQGKLLLFCQFLWYGRLG